MASMSQLTMAMVTLYSGDPKRIQHFMKVYAFAKMIAEHFGFAKYFDLIGGACMNGARTKKQEVIQYVLGQCEEKDLEKIRMVGDRCYDIEGANREGIRAIGVLYGYGSKEELEEAGADGLAETPEEVVRMILNGMHP